MVKNIDSLRTHYFDFLYVESLASKEYYSIIQRTLKRFLKIFKKTRHFRIGYSRCACAMGED